MKLDRNQQVEARSLRRQHWSHRQIAERFGVSRWIIQRVCRGISAPSAYHAGRRDAGEQTRAKVQALCAEGYSPKAISELAGLGLSTVYHHLPKRRARIGRCRPVCGDAAFLGVGG